MKRFFILLAIVLMIAPTVRADPVKRMVNRELFRVHLAAKGKWTPEAVDALAGVLAGSTGAAMGATAARMPDRSTKCASPRAQSVAARSYRAPPEEAP